MWDKYGKPILDRVVKMATPLADAEKAVLLSMDSTLRSNLSVGMPLDLAVIPVDTFHAHVQRIESDHKEYRQISDSWAASLRPRAGARKSGLQGLAEEELLGDETPLEMELGGIPAWDFGGRTAGTGTID